MKGLSSPLYLFAIDDSRTVNIEHHKTLHKTLHEKQISSPFRF